MLDHVGSDVHKMAMARMKADMVKASGSSAVLTLAIGRSMCTLDIEGQAQMKRKFELCFMMAKESIAFNKHPGLLQLQQRHSVDMGHAYSTVTSVKSFTGFMKLHVYVYSVYENLSFYHFRFLNVQLTFADV